MSTRETSRLFASDGIRNLTLVPEDSDRSRGLLQLWRLTWRDETVTRLDANNVAVWWPGAVLVTHEPIMKLRSVEVLVHDDTFPSLRPYDPKEPPPVYGRRVMFDAHPILVLGVRFYMYENRQEHAELFMRECRWVAKRLGIT